MTLPWWACRPDRCDTPHGWGRATNETYNLIPRTVPVAPITGRDVGSLCSL
jgi:hypothetical protein